MQFCPTCGNILLVDGSKEYSTMNRLFCRTCTYHIEVTRTIKRRIYPKNKEVDDILEDMAWGATHDIKCSRCGHNKAHFKEMQTRSADEPATLFFKCENKQCGFQWKEG